MFGQKQLLCLLAVTCALSANFHTAKAAAPGVQKQAQQYAGPDARVPDQLLVQFKNGVTLAQINDEMAAVKTKTFDNLVHSVYRAKYESDNLGAAFSKLKQSPLVEHVSSNYYLTKCGQAGPGQQPKSPGEPMFASQWYLSAVRVTSHQPSKYSAGIYLIDTGAPYPNQTKDLDCPVYDCYMGSYWGGDGDFNPGHGSMMASTIGARWNNIGTAGVHSQAGLVCMRVPKYGQGTMTEADILKAFAQIWHPGVDVINTIVIPYNAPEPYSLSNATAHPIFHSICKLFTEHDGSMIFVSAGNEGKNDPNPRVDYLNIVAACDEDGKLLPTSNYGKCVTFIAPGVNINCEDNMGNIVSGQGTSFSAAIAGAIAALIYDKSADGPKQKRLDDNHSVIRVMESTCQGGASENTGWGLPDYAKAVKAITIK